MHIEHSLAAQKITSFLAQGYSKECAIQQTKKFIKTQGFGAKYAEQVARQMADLVA